MAPNIFPEKVVKTRETSDGYVSEVFDFSTWQNIGFAGFIFIMILIAIFAPIFGGLILLYQTFTKKNDDEILNVVSLAFALYILFDIKKQWIISIIMIPFYNISETKEIIYFNYGLILVNFGLLFIGTPLYNMFGKSRFFYFLFTAVLTFVMYLLMKSIIN